MKLIHRVNIRNEIVDIKDSLIAEILESRKFQSYGYNFQVSTVYQEYLYNIFIDHSKKFLNSFTLSNADHRVWCYYADNSFQQGDVWHNHMNTSTINGVLYLETVKGCGLQYSTVYDCEKIGNVSHKDFNTKGLKYLEPKNYDLIIFPNFLNHRPIFSKKHRRISLNLELSCLENSLDIFAPVAQR